MKKQLLPNRKIIRLAEYDYGVDGVYFITICSKNRKKIFSEIKTEKFSDGSDTVNVELTEVGKTAEKYILSSERMDGVKIDDYVIMPNHIHLIVALECSNNINGGTSRAPSPTVSLCNNTDKFKGETSRVPSPTASLCNNTDEFNGGTSRVPSPTASLCNNTDEFNGGTSRTISHTISLHNNTNENNHGTSRAPSPTAPLYTNAYESNDGTSMAASSTVSLCNNADESNDGTPRAPSPTAEIYNTTEYNGGTSGTPSPTASHTPANAKLPRVIAAFKRLCNKEIGYNVFQRSYMEHIIRDFDDYIVKKNYVRNNPIRWIEDKYYI